ncbi:amino acid permease-domain-containing protein [Scleroderma yunnanense]
MLSVMDDDDYNLEVLGYKPSFRREFSNLATISFAFRILGLCSSIAMTFNTPLLLGGPASATWCWLLGSCLCFTLGSSIAEIVSAFPTCGGLYTASAQLCPLSHRAIVGWIVGWLSILGQTAGLASSEFGVANMILAAVTIASPSFEITQGKTVGLFTGLLITHGTLNSIATKYLAFYARGFVFVNLGATIVIIIVLLATTPRSEMHTASYVFGSLGIINQTGGWNTGIAFLFGLLNDCVSYFLDYDATAHISEEVRRAAYAAPSAIFIAVIGTGILGWILTIVLVLCSGNMHSKDLPGVSGSAFLQIMVLRMGTPVALFLWSFVCLTGFFVVQTGLQAGSRTFYAFSRDHGFLDLASPIAANAIFALTAMALDLSYIIPIFLRRVYGNHPEVQFKPVFSLPTVLPVTKENMNYAAIITVGVIVLSGLWYILGSHRHYHGPTSNLEGKAGTKLGTNEARPTNALRVDIPEKHMEQDYVA